MTSYVPPVTVMGKQLFSFAVISDTHLNEDEADCNSPFEVNKLANRRLRYVIDDLNHRDLAFVVHLGDVVHPVPSMEHLYAESAQCFHDQAKHLQHPLHIIPGNHDVGDKSIAWGPSGTVRDSFLDAWTEHFGSHYFCVKQGGLVFIGINAQLLGSGLAMEKEQAEWLEGALEVNKGSRVFLFTHYPPFLHDLDEEEHYDNLGSAGREWLLSLIDQYQIEAMFAGHVHHFWYNRFKDCQCYLMPSTAFSRQDYSEMFRVGPASEFGRNDADKLGYLIIHVHEQGHYFEMVRCYGREQDPVAKQNSKSLPSITASRESGTLPEPPFSNEQLKIFESLEMDRAINPLINRYPIMGFDLRHDWAEIVQIPPSGGLDEFDRKSVRNDYGLLALWEMGVKKLRIPLADLLSENRRQRIADLKELGFEFTLYSFGVPELDNRDFSQWLQNLISVWEISWPMDDLAELEPQIIALKDQLAEQMPDLVFSPLRSKADILASGRKYYHVINHGFTPTDKQLIEQLSALQTVSPMFSGFVIRCGIEDDVWETVKLCAEASQKTGLRAQVHLRLAGNNPAELIDDRTQVSRRLAEAMLAGMEFMVQDIYCDTLADNDRGYFPRVGVLDRLYNPQAGYYVVRNLHALFNE